ncbi:MAG TPA: serine hydrolase [Gemmatimonadales bacterium]|nr:serine hydrolase [Gemmatimonadales bacterium]
MASPARRRALALGTALAAALTAAAGPLVAQQPAKPPADLDAWVQRAMRELEVPGVGVAIVKDGRVVLAKGYGVRQAGRPEPVDAHTVFQIASNTKAYTSALLAQLVDEGKLHWDDRVQQHLPWFELSDPWVTREFTIRDLLTHRSGLGLGAGDLLWLGSDYPREEVVRRLRAVKPVTSFRTAYAYDNVLYIAAGLVVEAVTGQSWEDAVRERIFQPLGMREASTTVRGFQPGDNVAVPHGHLDGKLVVVPRDTVDNIGPAGAINANVADAAQWLIAQLDSGRAATGRRLWTPARTREMWAGVTIIPIGTPAPSLAALKPNFSEYALGWSLRDYKGHKLAMHSGGLSGMISRTILVPDQRLGVIVLTNAEASAHDAIAYHVLDAYLGGARPDWIAGFKAASGSADASADSVVAAAAAARAKDSKPSLPLARYAGRYVDAMYGDATITREGDRLVLRFSHSPAFTGDLEHWQYDTFVARWREKHIPDAYVTFALRADGSVDHFTMAAVSPAADFSYDYQDLCFRPAPPAPPAAAR